MTDDGTAVSLSSVRKTLIQWNPVSSKFLGKRKMVRDIGKFEKKSSVKLRRGRFCRYRKALYFWSLGISLYLELFCFLSFITIVLRNLCSGTHRRNCIFLV